MAPRDRPASPQPPRFDIDWDQQAWIKIGRQALGIVAEASTGWEARRPSPAVTAAEVRRRFEYSLPEHGTDAQKLLERVRDEVLPLSSYNGHPSWHGYITSSPNPVGVIGDLIASATNQNPSLFRAGPAATSIELQTIKWLAGMLGLPDKAEGIFSSGGQFANVIAHAVARNRQTGWDVRRFGLLGPEGAGRPMIYVSDQAHYCHDQAAELLGMGRESVRKIPSDDSYRIRIDRLSSAIEEDKASGRIPATIVANAGTVGSGAVDPIPELLEVARKHGLWLHVDGAYGAFAAIARGAPAELAAMSEADSVACDPHKWLYAPIDAGVTLFREPGMLEDSFAFQAAYLRQSAEPGRVNLVDRTPENTRPFRALKVWLALQAYGLDGYRQMIEWNIELARYMEQLVDATPGVVMAAPRQLSIVCWRCEPQGVELDEEQLERLQWEVILGLENRGVALVSNARLHQDRTALRACIVNFRTRPEHLERLVSESATLGEQLARRIAARVA